MKGKVPSKVLMASIGHGSQNSGLGASKGLGRPSVALNGSPNLGFRCPPADLNHLLELVDHQTGSASLRLGPGPRLPPILRP
jgi:hypothetical protein